MGEAMGKNRDRRLKGKKRNAVCLILIIIMTITVTGSFAYFSVVSKEIYNPITFGSVSVTIDEPGVNPDQVVYGVSSKPVQLVNNGGDNAADIVVRAMLVPLVETDAGFQPGEFAPMSEPVSNVMTVGNLKLHFADNWAEKWFYKEGMFYYRSVLHKGESTTTLLTGATLVDSTKGGNLQIKVLADALQAEGGAAQEAWNVQVSGTGTVTP